MPCLAPFVVRPSSASGPPERQSSGRPQGLPPPQPARGQAQAAPAPAAAPEPEPAAEEQQHLSEDQMRSKAKGLLAELYNTKDVKEAVICVK
jgi:hypothetical protein